MKDIFKGFKSYIYISIAIFKANSYIQKIQRIQKLLEAVIKGKGGLLNIFIITILTYSNTGILEALYGSHMQRQLNKSKADKSGSKWPGSNIAIPHI